MRRRLRGASGGGDVAVEPDARPAADTASSRLHRYAGLVFFGSLGLLVIVGSARGLLLRDAPRSAVRPADGVTVEERQLDLATSCVRDAANFDASYAEAWRGRLERCFTADPSMIGKLWDGKGSQVAAEPFGVVTARSGDGLAATVVVRLRVSGNPVPTFRYVQVDVGCRPTGECSLTTIPETVAGLGGDR